MNHTDQILEEIISELRNKNFDDANFFNDTDRCAMCIRLIISKYQSENRSGKSEDCNYRSTMIRVATTAIAAIEAYDNFDPCL